MAQTDWEQVFSPPSNEISHLPCGPQIALPLFPDSSCATLRSTKLKLLMLQKSGEPSNAYDQSPQLAGSTANSTVNCFFYGFLNNQQSKTSENIVQIKNFKTTIIWVFPKIGVPQIIHFNRVFHYKPSILGYHYFWKHPYLGISRIYNKLKKWYSDIFISLTSNPDGWYILHMITFKQFWFLKLNKLCDV